MCSWDYFTDSVRGFWKLGYMEAQEISVSFVVLWIFPGEENTFFSYKQLQEIIVSVFKWS